MPPDDTDTWLSSIRALELPARLRATLLDVTGDFVAHSIAEGGAPNPARAAGLGRFVDLGLLGRGGIGEVRRVRDPRLNRVMALKTLQSRWGADPALVERFGQEAQLTAQLQHPGIPPVHEVGVLPDGRPFFTLLEVRGAELGDAIAAAHGGPDRGRLRRLVEVVRRVAEAVAYAHSRDVLHRDLKPGNVMLGEFGEVWVLDWGLGKVQGPGPAAPVTDRSDETRYGAVQGTPAYMSPEQARGDVDAIGPATDVYALGGLLYAVLAGRPPRGGVDAAEAIARAAAGQVPPPPRGPWEEPEELVELCVACLQPQPDARPAGATAVASALQGWLDGAKARERARGIVDEAERQAAKAAQLREEAQGKRRGAAALTPAPTRVQEAWWPSWALEDEATGLDDEAALDEVHAARLAQAALTHAPDLREAHDWLADRALERHRAAERLGDRRGVAKEEVLLRAHGSARHAAYLTGRAALTLHTDPPGAEAVLHRWVSRHRLLELEPVRSLGRTPLDEVPLDHGSWVVELRAEGRGAVRWPVFLERGQHESGCRPGSSAAYPIHLPTAAELGPEDCYVPAGPCIAGRDEVADNDLPTLSRQRVWVDGFVARRHPVTTAEFLPFLNDLLDQGRGDEVERLVPRIHGEPAFGMDDGRFRLGAGPSGAHWTGASPVVLVTWTASYAFAAWHAERTGVSWRLGWELEWEKAARGADGRPYPWGWHVHSTWACMRGTPEKKGTLADVGEFPADTSVYGVSGMSGNACEWVLDPDPEGFSPIEGGVAVAPSTAESARRRLKGGAHIYRPSYCRVDRPGSGAIGILTTYQTLRLFRRLDPHAP